MCAFESLVELSWVDSLRVCSVSMTGSVINERIWILLWQENDEDFNDFFVMSDDEDWEARDFEEMESDEYLELDDSKHVDEGLRTLRINRLANICVEVAT